MTASDWKSQAQNQHEYSANTLKALSVDIAQRLEMQGGKKKVKRYELLTKEELVVKAKAKGIKGADALKKDKLIAVLRGKK